MKAVLLSLGVILGVSICALGFFASDFSGNWIGDIVRTDSISGFVNGKAEVTTRKLVVMVVKQHGAELEMESVWSNNSNTKRSYILDGNEHSSFEEGGNSIIYHAKLNGDQLLIQETRHVKTPFGSVEIPTKEEWELSADLNTLTVTTTTSTTQFGSRTQKQTYTRQ
jgi:hypothetical protein